MEPKFVLPSPKFETDTKTSLDNFSKLHKPHFSTPLGMQLPKSLQPPPMFGPRGPTIPPRFLNNSRANKPIPSTNHRKQQDNKPPISNWDAFCEICDIEFKGLDELENHKKEHRKCEIDGCKFIGHFRYMNKHLEMIHVSGLFDRMKKAESSEKAEQWRADRKRKYPTKENMLLRMEAQEERFKRGERIEESKSKFGEKNARFPNTQPQAKKRKRPARKNGRRKNQNADKKEKSDGIEEKYQKFEGTSNLVEYKPPTIISSLVADYGTSDEYSEEEEINEHKLNDSLLESQKCKDENIGVIFEGSMPNTIDKGTDVENHEKTNHLIKEKQEQNENEYQVKSEDESNEQVKSEDESNDQVKNDDESNDQVKNGEIKDQVKNNDSKDQANNDQQKATENTKPIGEKKVLDQNADKLRTTGKPKRKRHHKNPAAVGESSKPKIITLPVKKNILNYSKLRRAPQNTLLEKLIQPDIRHERNVLLQCVRYVVTSDFFGIGSSNAKKEIISKELLKESDLK